MSLRTGVKEYSKNVPRRSSGYGVIARDETIGSICGVVRHSGQKYPARQCASPLIGSGESSASPPGRRHKFLWSCINDASNPWIDRIGNWIKIANDICIQPSQFLYQQQRADRLIAVSIMALNTLIFGGSGKCARHITKLLSSQGHNVHSIIRNPDVSENDKDLTKKS
jgi:hypothetical protein